MLLAHVYLTGFSRPFVSPEINHNTTYSSRSSLIYNTSARLECDTSDTNATRVRY